MNQDRHILDNTTAQHIATTESSPDTTTDTNKQSDRLPRSNKGVDTFEPQRRRGSLFPPTIPPQHPSLPPTYTQTSPKQQHRSGTQRKSNTHHKQLDPPHTIRPLEITTTVPSLFTHYTPIEQENLRLLKLARQADKLLIAKVLATVIPTHTLPAPHLAVSQHTINTMQNVIANNQSQATEVLASGIVLCSTIGAGGFSKVKLGLHVATGEYVAVKLIEKSQFDKHPTSPVQVMREIAILSQLNHPNVNRLLQVIDSPSTLYIVLDYEPSGDLFTYIKTNHPIPEDTCRALFAQIVTGIAYCHARGVVHRDLKPENILISHNTTLKIADFGLATAIQTAQTQHQTFCGSPAYTPPEIIARTPYVGQYADMWCVGCILHTLVVGSLPFDDRNPARMLVHIVQGRYKPLPKENTSSALRALVAALLVVDPASRLTAQEVASHVWMRGSSVCCTGNRVDDHSRVREEVVDRVRALGLYTDTDISSFVNGCVPGHVKTAYCLLEKLMPLDPILSHAQPTSETDLCDAEGGVGRGESVASSCDALT